MKSILSLVLCIFIGVGCIEEIPVEFAQSQHRWMVVQGRLLTGAPDHVTVKVSSVGSFGADSQVVFIDDATVYLTDSIGNQVRVPSVGKGLYKYDFMPNDNMIPLADKYYQLSVSLSDKNYISGWEPLHQVPHPDSIVFTTTQKQSLNNQGNIITENYVQYSLYTPTRIAENMPPVALMWEFEETFRFIELEPPFPFLSAKTCYITRRVGLNRLALHQGNTSLGLLQGREILENQLGGNYAFGNYLTTHQYALSEGAFQYWEAVNTVIDRSGSIFDPPPGKIKGNMRNEHDASEEVLGYFFASDLTTLRVFVSPEALDYPDRPCDIYPSWWDASATCKDCLVWPNSTVVRPDYWIE